MFVKAYEYRGGRGSLARFVEELAPAVSRLMRDVQFVYAMPAEPFALPSKDRHLRIGLRATRSRWVKMIDLARSEARLHDCARRLQKRGISVLVWEITPWLTSLWGSRITVTTVHDLLPLDYCTGRHWFYHRFVVVPALRRKLCCVADSRRTTNLLSDRAVASVTTVSCWVSPQLEAARMRAGFDPESPLLFVGNLVAYKNLNIILELYQATAVRRPLRCVVPREGARDLSQEVRRRRLDGRVEVISDLTDGQIARAYASAFALIFPSLDEGFGMPALEAMAHGLPVVASDTPIMHEVCGDAALYFAPCDLLDLSQGLQRLEHEDVWQAFSEAGRHRAALYSLDDAANRYRDIFENCLPALARSGLGIRQMLQA